MAVAEPLVASVVLETSERMKDANYVQLAVGNFVECQPQVAQYLSARAARIGGAQSVLELAFHAEFLCECLRKSSGAPLRQVDFKMLDRAAQGDAVARFASEEPALASYVASNVELPELRTELCRIGLALLHSRAPAKAP